MYCITSHSGKNIKEYYRVFLRAVYTTYYTIN